MLDFTKKFNSLYIRAVGGLRFLLSLVGICPTELSKMGLMKKSVEFAVQRLLYNLFSIQKY